MGSRYTPEFRAEAVRLALTSGLPRRQIAADLGVGYSSLNNWIGKDRTNQEKLAGQSDLEREVAELRRENRLFREERGGSVRLNSFEPFLKWIFRSVMQPPGLAEAG